jgi:hypothetical protein
LLNICWNQYRKGTNLKLFKCKGYKRVSSFCFLL